MTARLVPERTVDSLFAVEVVRHDPYALIWSPTQYAGSFDHAVLGSGGDARLGIFECKAVVSDAARRPRAPWTAPIDLAQLAAHAAAGRGGVPVVYVLMGKPESLDRPYRRYCDERGCDGKWCRACCRDRRSWGLIAPSVAEAPLLFRYQPWFCHWSWVVTAKELQSHLGASAAGSHNLPLGDASMRRVPGAKRLCHFLEKHMVRGKATTNTRWSILVAEAQNYLSNANWPSLSDDDEDGGGTPPVLVLFQPGS